MDLHLIPGHFSDATTRLLDKLAAGGPQENPASDLGDCKRHQQAGENQTNVLQKGIGLSTRGHTGGFRIQPAVAIQMMAFTSTQAMPSGMRIFQPMFINWS